MARGKVISVERIRPDDDSQGPVEWLLGYDTHEAVAQNPETGDVVTARGPSANDAAKDAASASEDFTSIWEDLLG